MTTFAEDQSIGSKGLYQTNIAKSTYKKVILMGMKSKTKDQGQN